jgi:branched-chain amino acid transport system permease protein
MYISILFDILKLSGIYITMGLGFVMIYRASRVINLSQPGLIMLGSFLALAVLPRPEGGATPSLEFWATSALLILVGGVVGLVIYTLLIKPMAGNPRISIVLMTLAALFMFEAVIDIVWPGERGFLRLPGNTTAYELIGSRVRLFDIVPFVVGLSMWAGVTMFYRWSRIGIRIRAVAENAALAARRGINIDRVGAVSWNLSLPLGVCQSIYLHRYVRCCYVCDDTGHACNISYL